MQEGFLIFDLKKNCPQFFVSFSQITQIFCSNINLTLLHWVLGTAVNSNLNPANQFPVIKTGFSLWSFSHKEIPVMNTGSLQWEKVFPVMKTGFSLWEKLHRANPVLALYWPCTGLQWKHIYTLLYRKLTCNLQYPVHHWFA